MDMSLHALAIGTFVPMLRATSKLLTRGAEHTRTDTQDEASLVDARLAPDMYPLADQIRLACRHATETIERFTGIAASIDGPSETTIEDLVARIDRVLVYLEAASAADVDEAAGREFVVPLDGGLELVMNGFELVRDWALPNFYFHVVTAYDVLRHEGVDIGKRDYLRHVGRHVRRPGRA